MTHSDHLIAELVNAMGLGKIDYDGLSISQSKDMIVIENVGNSNDGTLRCSSMLPSNAIPRVNI
jgi:hypothetical protein